MNKAADADKYQGRRQPEGSEVRGSKPVPPVQPRRPRPELKCTELTDPGGRADGSLQAGTSDACVIDLLMAGAMIGEGTSYTDLTYTVKLNSEEYGVGFRKGSDLAAALNDFFAASYKDGSLKKTAETYGVQESLIAQ